MLTHDRINSINIDIRLLYYLHLYPQQWWMKDLDAIWRYRSWEKRGAEKNIPPTPHDIRTLILEELVNE
ncbi:hypothetical protein LCGC14_1596440 [marine sediment metagenome]|uniref:Uncharacterized protein n=1 Tax=marine sediment metagenome TaxID=412755 RepID=A0A0F9ICV3_9ZZZZ